MPSASLISTFTPNAPAAARAAADRQDAPAYSYDDAVSALERASSRALDIHGGAPSAALPPARAGVAARASANAKGEIGRPDQGSAATGRNAAAAASEPRTATPAAKPASPSTVSPTASAPVNAGAIALPPAQLAISAPTTATALRAAGARGRPEAPAPTISIRAPATALRQFAEILAQRLDNASQFELRLDPPAFGSIDGRLTLSDDGRAVLSLAFDNQSAFDHFRRDEAALRQTLANAGFDLAGHDLQFAFRDSPTEAPTPDSGERPAIVAPPHHFTPSPLHRGAVDIRA